VPTLVLDEQTEVLWWDTANYFQFRCGPAGVPATPGSSPTPGPCTATPLPLWTSQTSTPRSTRLREELVEV
jgi:hypothetical protein